MQVCRAAWVWLLAHSGAAGLGQVHGSYAEGRPKEAGQTLAEYSLILALVAVTAIVAMLFFGSTLAQFFWNPISEEFGRVLRGIFGP